MSRPRFYLDENVPVAVEAQSLGRGVDVLSARTAAALGESDPQHLARSTALGRVLCTHDADFLRLAAQGVEHAGIAFAASRMVGIGAWVRAIRRLHQEWDAEALRGRVVFVPADQD